MFYRISLLIALPLLILGCQKIEKTPKPENLIPEDKMVEILVDLAKIDAAMSVSTKEYEKRGVVGRELILKKHQVDSLQLVQSNAYYAENFRVNQRIYERVEAILKFQNDSLNEINERLKQEKRSQNNGEN